MKAALALAGLLALAGCKSAGTIAGLVGGGAAGAATASPAVGYLVGLGVAVAADEAVRYYGRTRQQAEQDAIADAAGTLREGDAAPWRIRHDIPIGNEHGTVAVVRIVANPLADCREIVFSVEDPPAAPVWFGSSICHRARRWKWAEAEPSVVRWGLLQ